MNNRIGIIHCWEEWESDLPLKLSIICDAMQTDVGRESLLRDAEQRCDSTMIHMLNRMIGKEVDVDMIRNFFMLDGIHMVGIKNFEGEKNERRDE